MATKYIKSGASGSASGADYANAYLTVEAFFLAASPGDIGVISPNHAQSGAAVTLTSPGTAAAPCILIFAANENEPATDLAAKGAGGSITCNTNSAISYAGFCVVRGGGNFIVSGSGTSGHHNWTSANPFFWDFDDDVSLKITGTNAGQRFIVGQSGNSTEDDNGVRWNKAHLTFGATGQGVRVQCALKWLGGSVEGATTPTTLFLGANGNSGCVKVKGVDLSALGSGKYLVDAAMPNWTIFDFEDCKLGSGVTICNNLASHPGQGGVVVRGTNCDSSDTNNRHFYYDYRGSAVSETTIVRSGGASDGTNAISWKVATTAGASFYMPFEVDQIIKWNTALSSKTFTVSVLTDNVTLKDDEAWLDLDYQGTSGFPLSVLASDRRAFFGTAANQDTDSGSTWTTTGLGTPVKQKLNVTVTPAEVGWVKGTVKIGKPSTTVYVDVDLQVS